MRRELEWTDVHFENSFKLTADIIGEHIFLTHSSGSATLTGARKAFDFTARLINTQLPERPYVHILDYTHLKGATLESRRFFIHQMLQRQHLQGLIFFGLSPLMKISAKLGRRFSVRPLQVQIANDYRQAVQLALDRLAEVDCRPGADADDGVIAFAITRGGVNLPIVRRPEWTMEAEDFSIRYEIIAGCIIHSVSCGYLRDIHLPELFTLRDAVAASVKQVDTLDYIIMDMSGLRGYERRARKHYTDNLIAWHRRSPLKGFIPYGLNHFMGAAVNLFKFLMPFKVYVARNLEDALEIINATEGELTTAAHRTETNVRRISEEEKPGDSIERLLAYIGGIDWEASGPIERVPDQINPAFQPVFDAMGLIKSELDDLIREKALAEAALYSARNELETRVRERTAELVATNRALNREISERREAEQALRASEKNYRDLVDSVNSIILRWDVHGRIVFMNSYGLFFFGYRSEEIFGRSVIGTIVPETEGATRRDLKALMRAIQRDPGRYRTNENENIKKDGSRVWVYWNNRAIKGKAGRIVEILSVGTDITARRKMEAELRRLATTDPLTGAFNRRQFFDKAKNEFQRHRRYGRAFVLLLMDLDHFKRINDNFGHPAGDAALKSFVNTARMIFRETDIFGRTGGEEFSAVLPETETDNAVTVADRLRAKVAALRVIAEGKSIHYTVSIGLTEMRPEDQTLREMVRRADEALYEAKGTGRNRVVRR